MKQKHKKQLLQKRKTLKKQQNKEKTGKLIKLLKNKVGLGKIGCLVEALRHCGNGPAVKNTTAVEAQHIEGSGRTAQRCRTARRWKSSTSTTMDN